VRLTRHQDFYNSFRLKLVDSALQQGLFKVIAETNIETEEDCEAYNDPQAISDGTGALGSHWIDQFCLRLFREFPNGQTCERQTLADGPAVPEGENGRPCTYAPATQVDLNNIVKYELDIRTYVEYTYNCTTQGNGTVDMVNLPLDGSLPLCWFSLETLIGNFQWRSTGTGSRGAKTQKQVLVEDDFAQYDLWQG